MDFWKISRASLLPRSVSGITLTTSGAMSGSVDEIDSAAAGKSRERVVRSQSQAESK